MSKIVVWDDDWDDDDDEPDEGKPFTLLHDKDKLINTFLSIRITVISSQEPSFIF